MLELLPAKGAPSLLFPCLSLLLLGPAGNTQQWVEVPASGAQPPAREQHALAYDPVTQRTILFGGLDPQGRRIADTWSWNGSTWSPLAGATSPGPRSGHGLAADGRGLVLFGGETDGGLVLGDTWVFDANGWRQVIPTSSPPPRRDHAMAATREGILLFGGRDGTGTALGDTWLWDGRRWRDMSPSTSPLPSFVNAMTFDAGRGRVVLAGAVPTAEVWEWDGRSWSSVRCNCASPTGLPGWRMAYDPVSEVAVLFGRNTWAWDGATWTSQGRPNNLVARVDHGLAVDAEGRLLLFGGRIVASTPPLLGDTWVRVPAQVASAIPFGSACGRPGVQPSLRAVSVELPYLGGTFRAEFLSLPPGTPAVLAALSLSRTSWAGNALPLDLGPFGMPGCSAFVGLDALTLVVGSGGSAIWPIQLPAVPQAAGLEIFTQGLVPDPTANAAGFAVSNALLLVPGLAPSSVEEAFDDDRKLDRERSSGDWSGGLGTFGTIGGSGTHGDFDPTLGTFLGEIGGKKTYEWNTDALRIPARDSHTGTSVVVQNGRFEFTRMLVPADVSVRFEGSSPVELTASGELEVLGELVCDAEDVPGGFDGAPAVAMNTPGQPGGLGGPGGGRGGAGGDRCDGLGAQPRFDGRPGQDVRNRMGTGGQGSTLFPANGLTSSVVAPFGNFFSFQSAAGGGGGGFIGAGGSGMAVSNTFNNPAYLGPPAAGGMATNLFPIPPGTSSLAHFLLGGAGGGGGASHPLFSNTFVISWSAGAGGAGGGGAAALRAGRALVVGSQATVSARGGSGADYTGSARQGTPAPGGGGSGGSIVLQSGETVSVPGAFDVRGGRGGSITRAFSAGGGAITRGGDGGDGMIRLEAPASQVSGVPPATLLPGAMPAATASNVGVLQDVDTQVAFQSKWFSVFPRRDYVRYELEALVNGTRMVFSDDPAVGPLALPGSQPVGILFQAADRDLLRGADPETRLPWRQRVGRFGPTPTLADDAMPAFRFAVVLDRSFGATVQVDRVTVFLR